MASGKSVQSVQDSALNQFKFAANVNQHDKLNEYLELSRKKVNAFKEATKNRETTLLARGYTNTQLDKIAKVLEMSSTLLEQRKNSDINNTNRHSLLNSVLNIFGIENVYDITTLSKFQRQEHVLLEDDTIKVKLICGKCLSSSMKMSVIVYSLKPYFRKSDTYDQDKLVITDHKWIDTTITFTAKYGNLFTFRRSLLPNFTSIIEKYMIVDLNDSTDTEEDIWSFKF